MILTLRPDKKQEAFINTLKQMYHEKTATNAVLKAVDYAANSHFKYRTEIAELKNQITELNERDTYIKSLIRKVLKSIPILLKYSEGQKI